MGKARVYPFSKKEADEYFIKYMRKKQIAREFYAQPREYKAVGYKKRHPIYKN